jgi:glycosyltransferase involved in cell wall biosynthesis
MKFGAEVVLVPGPAAARTVKAAGVAASRIFESFNSIDQDAVLRAVDQSHRAPGGDVRICYIGQLIPRKNVAALIEAFFNARIGQAELHIVGQGPLERDLRGRASGRDSANRCVHWHGPQSPEETLAVMARCHVLVLPSTEEVWGLVVNEALTAGLSVVLSRLCGVYESVRNMPGVVGIDGSIKDLAHALESLSAGPRGWIDQPEILRTGSPQQFAAEALSAVEAAKNRVDARPEFKEWRRRYRHQLRRRNSAT